MAKGKTLWEMLTGLFQAPPEQQVYNPLRAKVGSPVEFDDLELRDYSFSVHELREYRRTIGSRQFVFVDYVVVARPPGKDDIVLRLRLNPVDPATRTGGLTHHVLQLRLDEQMAYSEDFHNVVRDTTKKFQVLEDGQVTAEYWRINDVGESYKARVTVLRDANEDRKVDAEEVERHQIEYWDYWRETPDVGGQPFTEYLFVEMDADSGWFQIWRGREIDPKHVTVL